MTTQQPCSLAWAGRENIRCSIVIPSPRRLKGHLTRPPCTASIVLVGTNRDERWTDETDRCHMKQNQLAVQQGAGPEGEQKDCPVPTPSQEPVPRVA